MAHFKILYICINMNPPLYHPQKRLLPHFINVLSVTKKELRYTLIDASLMMPLEEGQVGGDRLDVFNLN